MDERLQYPLTIYSSVSESIILGARIQVRPNVRVALDVAMEEARAGASNSILDGVTGTVWAFGSMHLIGDLTSTSWQG